MPQRRVERIIPGALEPRQRSRRDHRRQQCGERVALDRTTPFARCPQMALCGCRDLGDRGAQRGRATQPPMIVKIKPGARGNIGRDNRPP